MSFPAPRARLFCSSDKCQTPEAEDAGSVTAGATDAARRVEGPWNVHSHEFEHGSTLGKGSSATVFAGGGYQGGGKALKVRIPRLSSYVPINCSS